MKHYIEDLPKVIALASFLDCNPDDLDKESYDHYGLDVYSRDGREYAVGTDSEATKAAIEYIRGSIWAFNASFILEQCDLPMELEDAIRSYQAEQCENANDALLALVERLTTIEDFAGAAISCDSRAHFLATYDGEENEEGEFFIYRIN